MKTPRKSYNGRSNELGSAAAASRSKGEWLRVRYELQPKTKTVTVRMSEALLEAIKLQAEQSGINYQKFIRLSLEREVQRKQG
jgi:predicted DNA binding CopG/RHH family protein